MKHTKLPWIGTDLHSAGDTQFRVESKDEHGVVNDGWIICNCYGPDQEANSKFIATACNAHADLVKVLKSLEWSGIAEGMGSGPHGSGGDGYEHPACPSCGGVEPTEHASREFTGAVLGHKKTCKLIKALKKAQGE